MDKIRWLVGCMLPPIAYYDGQNVKELNIEEPEWNFLNRLKKQPDKSGFYYWHQTVRLLKNIDK